MDRHRPRSDILMLHEALTINTESKIKYKSAKAVTTTLDNLIMLGTRIEAWKGLGFLKKRKQAAMLLDLYVCNARGNCFVSSTASTPAKLASRDKCACLSWHLGSVRRAGQTRAKPTY